MSMAHRGKQAWHTGRKMPASFRKACSDGQKKLYANGYVHPMQGKKHTKESIEKMRKWAAEHPKYGKNNPAYGTHQSEENKQKISDTHSKGVIAINISTGEEMFLKNIKDACGIFNVSIFKLNHDYTYGRLKGWRFTNGE